MQSYELDFKEKPSLEKDGLVFFEKGPRAPSLDSFFFLLGTTFTLYLPSYAPALIWSCLFSWCSCLFFIKNYSSQYLLTNNTLLAQYPTISIGLIVLFISRFFLYFPCARLMLYRLMLYRLMFSFLFLHLNSSLFFKIRVIGITKIFEWAAIP